MKGIVITVLPENAECVQISFPCDLSKKRFEQIVKHVANQLPQLTTITKDRGCVTVATLNQDEINNLMDEKVSIKAFEELKNLVGSQPDALHWSSAFVKMQDHPAVKDLLKVMSDNYDDSLDRALNNATYYWLIPLVKYAK